MTWSRSKQNGTMDTLPSFPLKSRMLIIRMLAINSCMDEVSADPFHLCREIIVPKLTWGLLQSIEVITQLSEKPVSWFKARRIFPPTSGGAFGRGRGRANMTGSFLGPHKWRTFSGFTGQSFGTRCWQEFQKCQLKHICFCFKAWFHEMHFFGQTLNGATK